MFSEKKNNGFTGFLKRWFGRLSSHIIFMPFVLSAMVMLPISVSAIDLQRIEPSNASLLQDVIILDARPAKNWQAGHIPGALSFSWENYTRTDPDGVKWRIFPPEELGNALGSLGISNKDNILVYGDADSSWGGEGWVIWMLAWLGHEGRVYFLDGGIQIWKDKGQPVTSDAGSQRPPAKYLLHLQPHVNMSSEQIEAQAGNIQLIDTRNYLTEWLPGHLPGAVHLSWEKFYQGSYRQILEPEALKSLLEKQGVDVKKPAVYYCSAGIRSGFTWLVHQLSGLPAAVNFEGGTEEWSKKRKLVR